MSGPSLIDQPTTWETYFDVERYPTLSARWEAGACDARAEAFEFGLQRVLDGLEAYLHG